MTLDAPVTASSAAGRRAQFARIAAIVSPSVARAGTTRPLPRLPGQQVGVVLDVEVHDRSGSTAVASRLSASVVLRVTIDDVVVTGADERRDLAAGSLVSAGAHRGGVARRRGARWSSSGSSSATRSATARSAGALAA